MPKQIRHITPESVHPARGYTHAVTATGGTTVYVSGQIAFDREGNLVGEGDFTAQARQALANLKDALEAAGASLSDIVKMNTYIVNYSPALLPGLREARAEYFSGGDPPASTLIGVQALAFEGLLIEIEAVAVID